MHNNLNIPTGKDKSEEVVKVWSHASSISLHDCSIKSGFRHWMLSHLEISELLTFISVD